MILVRWSPVIRTFRSWFFRNGRATAAAAVGLVSALIATGLHENPSLQFSLIAQGLDAGDPIQAFYDTGQGFRESDTLQNDPPTDASSGFVSFNASLSSDYRFGAPREFRGFRVDLGTHEASISIRTIALTVGTREYSWSGAEILKNFGKLNDLQTVEAGITGLAIKTTGNDPYLIYTGPALEAATDWRTVRGLALFRAGILTGGLLLAILLYSCLGQIRWGLGRLHDILESRTGVYHALLALLCAWYLFQVAFFAFGIRHGIPPDEKFHFRFAQYFTEHLIPPVVDSPETYRLGPISTKEYLYHWIIGDLLQLNGTHLSDQEFARLLNLIFASGILASLVFLLRNITRDRFAHLTALAVISNTLMFTFLASALNADNLQTLLSILLVAFLVRILRSPRWPDVLYFACAGFAGLLTKVTFAPFFAAAVAVAAAAQWRWIFATLGSWRGPVSLRPKYVLAGCVTFVLFVLSSWHYGENLFLYHTLRPNAGQVLGEAAALEYAPYRVKLALRETTSSRPVMGTSDYVWNWFLSVQAKTFGIMAHQNMEKSKNEIRYFYDIFFWVSVFASIFALYRFPSERAIVGSVLGIAIVYAGIVLWWNHSIYLDLHLFGAALHGRYLFPVYPALVCGLAAGTFRVMPRELKPIAWLTVILLFTARGFPWFLANAGSERF